MSIRHVIADVAQVLPASERKGFRGYATGKHLERLAGDDTVVVLHVGDVPSRLDQWLPWRDARPVEEFAPVVVVDPAEAPTDGVYVREYRHE